MKPWVTPADGVTALRAPLAGVFPFLHQPAARLAVLAIVTASDVVDGALARRFGGSRMGAVLDPVADKLFMLAAFGTVWRSGILSGWEIVGVLLRDVIAALGGVTVWLLHRPVALPARAGGKAVTVCQMLTLVAFVAESPLVRPLAWATAAISCYALWDYGRAAARVTEEM